MHIYIHKHTYIYPFVYVVSIVPRQCEKNGSQNHTVTAGKGFKHAKHAKHPKHLQDLEDS